MTWSALFGVLLLSHLVGDFMFQTDWQAHSKEHGLGRNPEARRALAIHALIYTLAFTPAFVWVGVEASTARALGGAALVLGSHVIIDDGTLVGSWVRHVKHVHGPPPIVVRLGVDQSLHVLMLAGVALLATG